MSARHLPRAVTIVYRRLPNDVRQFRGTLRKATPTSLMIESSIAVTSPRRVLGKVVADSGFLAIWFIYRHKWYDVGKFYDRARNWIGYYCDIIRPLNRLLKTPARTVMITDLFLDLWITPGGRTMVLDEEEFENGLKRGYMSNALAGQARKEMDSLIHMVRAGRFPPPSIQRVEPLNSCNGHNTHKIRDGIMASGRVDMQRRPRT
jgi:predicted RNA-binding protein associated with RNAse of E/G family